ncbi:MAG TPA: PHB depolymerase family esterase [Gemmatimonadales bacterium]|nr:PHB depolymerase family esterase [Gemmatimonadales bacterium]
MTWARLLLAVAVVLSPAEVGRAQSGAAHLEARPGVPDGRVAPGLTALGLSATRDTYLYIPAGYRPNHPAPLLVLLHGATQSAELWTRSSTLFALADSMGLVLLMPNSRGRTWDLMMEGFGPDVALLDSALTLVFRRGNIDPKHIALGGFSDGATYALSLGVGNGDLLSALIAFSPGYLAPAGRRGSPRIFIAHGTDDRILPINSTSRRIVPMLKQAGYVVEYHEFEGPHTVRPDQLRAALAWFVAP